MAKSKTEKTGKKAGDLKIRKTRKPESPAALLRLAWRLLKEVGWTQNVWARDERGREVGGYKSAPNACSFCLFGVLGGANILGGFSRGAKKEAVKALQYEVRARGHDGGYILWNDRPERTRDEVIEVINAAIRRVSV